MRAFARAAPLPVLLALAACDGPAATLAGSEPAPRASVLLQLEAEPLVPTLLAQTGATVVAGIDLSSLRVRAQPAGPPVDEATQAVAREVLRLMVESAVADAADGR